MLRFKFLFIVSILLILLSSSVFGATLIDESICSPYPTSLSPTESQFYMNQDITCLLTNPNQGAINGGGSIGQDVSQVLDCRGHKITGRSTFSDSNGIGVLVGDGDRLTLKNCVIEGFGRGVVINNDGLVSIQDSIIRSNVIGVELSTNVYSHQSGNEIVRSKIYGNRGTGGIDEGTGVYVRYGTEPPLGPFFTIRDSEIYDNERFGVQMYGKYLTIQGSDIKDNGMIGVYVLGSLARNVLIDDSTISQNTNTLGPYGNGAIVASHTSGYPIDVRNSLILNNGNVLYADGGILVNTGSSLTSSNNYVCYNSDVDVRCQNDATISGSGNFIGDDVADSIEECSPLVWPEASDYTTCPEIPQACLDLSTDCASELFCEGAGWFWTGNECVDDRLDPILCELYYQQCTTQSLCESSGWYWDVTLAECFEVQCQADITTCDQSGCEEYWYWDTSSQTCVADGCQLDPSACTSFISCTDAGWYYDATQFLCVQEQCQVDPQACSTEVECTGAGWEWDTTLLGCVESLTPTYCDDVTHRDCQTQTECEDRGHIWVEGFNDPLACFDANDIDLDEDSDVDVDDLMSFISGLATSFNQVLSVGSPLNIDESVDNKLTFYDVLVFSNVYYNR